MSEQQQQQQYLSVSRPNILTSPLFGRSCSVENVHDSFGPTLQRVLSKGNLSHSADQDEREEEDPSINTNLEVVHNSAETLPKQSQDPSSDHPAGNDEGLIGVPSSNVLQGFLKGAALMGSRNDHADSESEHEDDAEEEDDDQHDTDYSELRDSNTDSLAPSSDHGHGQSIETHLTEVDIEDLTDEEDEEALRQERETWDAAKREAFDDARKDKRRTRALLAKLRRHREEKRLRELQQAKGVSMMDEDDQLAKDLERQAADLLQEAGDEHLEQMGGFSSENDEEDIKAEREQSKGTTVVRRHGKTIKIDAETKLRALISEFGESAVTRETQEPERHIADAPGVLIRTVLIKGTICLTNHRICFVAFIASSQDNNPREDGQIHDPQDENPILKSGPAILHRSGLRRKRTVWLELRKKSIACYPSSNKLYNPIENFRLQGNVQMMPHDWSKPNTITFVSQTRCPMLEFATEEATLDWRRELEAASFTFNNTAEKIRISLPLARILSIDSSDHLQFARIIHLTVLDDHADAEERSEMHDGHPITRIALGTTLNQIHLLRALRSAMEEPTSWRKSVGSDEVMRRTPECMVEIEGPRSEEEKLAEEAESEDPNGLAAKICKMFALPPQPNELKIVKADIVRTIPSHGTLAIGLDHLCFWRRAIAAVRDMKVKIPLADLQGVDKSRSFRWHYHGMVLHIRAHPDLYFEFYSRTNRDSVMALLRKAIENKPSKATKTERTQCIKGDDSAGACQLLADLAYEDPPVVDETSINLMPKIVNVPRSMAMLDRVRIAPMRIYCLTIGSRGDVQPYIALAKGLKEHNHTPVIVSHPEYKGWVESHGIEFRGVGGDPGALMKLSVEHRIFSPAFFKESIGKFRVWLDELLRECWEQCQGADLLIESPSTMAGIHVAEGLNIPYFRAFTMPWTKTSAYPQAFSVPAIDMGASYNSSSYVLFDQVLWRATSGQVNRWRKHMVGIPPTDLTKLQPDNVPFIYNFSPAVVPTPNDWNDRIKVSGYWFLDNPDSEWKAPEELKRFIAKAKTDGKKLAYIGFGSITIDNADEVTRNICQAVKDADVRAIVAKGWSARMSGSSSSKKKKTDASEHEFVIPEEVFAVDSIPHDWLFPQIDIAMHHGGAGTTGASLRAGLVTLIKPFFGDQYFWALRVKKLGAGLSVSGLGAHEISSALKAASSDRIMVEKAQGVGERIRSENGVSTAIDFIYRNIALAKRRGTVRPPSRANSLRSATQNSLQSTDVGTPESEEEKGASKLVGLRRVSSPLALVSGGPRTKAGQGKAGEDGGEQSPSGYHSPLRASTTTSFMSTIGSGLGSMAQAPLSLTSALKELVVSGDATEGEDEKGSMPPSPHHLSAATTPDESGGKPAEGEKSFEERQASLKGYKNAKAEDIRRRKLLEERLRREREEKAESIKSKNQSLSKVTESADEERGVGEGQDVYRTRVETGSQDPHSASDHQSC
ncbi:hypothetical protein IE53DRAFT_384854 [Violaceomyces palustris]|uniref:Uncharacterized protein n=1 Tax=Violaceomyces palustris TaxID=1673888 RepID=A0ACD0P3Q4_9BASI|nr:hypothetical protein IE53DRAFT_384854 [Violaceomyces palustris]